MEFIETKEKVSTSMLKWAWTLEIIFCINGLFIALALSYAGLGYTSTGDFSSSQKLGFIISLLPLIAIALTELIKIPVVHGILYSKNIKKKVFSTFFLLFICFLTFETMVTGLEQNIANREHTIEGLRMKNLSAFEKSTLLDINISNLQSISEEEIKINKKKGLNLQLGIFNDQIADLKERSNSLLVPIESSQILELRRQITSLENKKNQSIKSFEKRVDSLRLEISNLNNYEQKELERSIFKGSIRTKYSKSRSSYLLEIEELSSSHEVMLESLNKEIKTLDTKIVALVKPNRNTLKEVKEIALEIKLLNQKKGEQISINTEEIKVAILDSKNKEQKISNLLKEKEILASQIESLRNNINSESNSSFIHRMSARIYGKDSAADLTKEEVSLISLIFVLSIALIASISGPFLAFLSVSNSIEETSKKRPKKPGLKGSLRKMLISLKKRLLKPKILVKTEKIEVVKEVIKEIPIEKKVYTTVEVPTPVEVTRFIGVPVPTNPTDLPEYPEPNDSKIMPLFSLKGGVQ